MSRTLRTALFGLIAPLAVMLPVLGGASDRSDPPPAAPHLVIDQESLDIGVVESGEDAVATFVLRNDGGAPLHVLKAKPS